MRPTPFALAALAILAGCSGPERWVGPGGQPEFNRAQAACRTQAVQQMPPAFMQAQAAPVVIVNPRPTGYITSVPTWQDSPRDMNRAARNSLVDDCLILKGYSRKR